jgi:hypothetical protein
MPLDHFEALSQPGTPFLFVFPTCRDSKGLAEILLVEATAVSLNPLAVISFDQGNRPIRRLQQPDFHRRQSHVTREQRHEGFVLWKVRVRW